MCEIDRSPDRQRLREDKKEKRRTEEGVRNRDGDIDRAIVIELLVLLLFCAGHGVPDRAPSGREHAA